MSEKPEPKRKKLYKSNFVVLFILSATVLIWLFKNAEITAMTILYLIFGCAVVDIVIDAEQDKSKRVRAILWIVLEGVIGIGIAVNYFLKENIVLGCVVLIYFVAMTISEAGVLKKQK